MKKYKKLVFIDDDKATNYFHNIIIKNAEICEEAIFFESAQDALVYFEELIEKEEFEMPEYIFLDINMPVMNGWQFIAEFEKFNIKHPLFIIMLTTSLNRSDQEKADEMELISEFWNKPLAIQKLIELKSQREQS